MLRESGTRILDSLMKGSVQSQKMTFQSSPTRDEVLHATETLIRCETMANLKERTSSILQAQHLSGQLRLVAECHLQSWYQKLSGTEGLSFSRDESDVGVRGNRVKT